MTSGAPERGDNVFSGVGYRISKKPTLAFERNARVLTFNHIILWASQEFSLIPRSPLDS